MNYEITERAGVSSNGAAGEFALREMLIDELSDLYSAEHQLIQALPKFVQSAKSEELRKAFASHLEETHRHVLRLEETAKAIGEPLKQKTCSAMAGVLEEANQLLAEFEDSSALDAGLIISAQKAEHYEIATYGTVVAWARRLGYEEVGTLLEMTLEEEKAANDLLSGIAEGTASEVANRNAV